MFILSVILIPVIPMCMATAPARARDTTHEAEKALNDWHQIVEPEVQYDRNPNPDFWTRILHLHARLKTSLSIN